MELMLLLIVPLAVGLGFGCPARFTNSCARQRRSS
jgi:hypothetical protein